MEDEDLEAPPEGYFEDLVEPGSPSAENALFVLLGALSTLAVIFRLAGIV